MAGYSNHNGIIKSEQLKWLAGALSACLALAAPIRVAEGQAAAPQPAAATPAPVAPAPDAGLIAAQQPSDESETVNASTTQPSGPSNTITLAPAGSRTLSLDHKIKKAEVLAPDVADVHPLNPTDLLLTGKKAGITQLLVWDENDRTQVFQLVVQSNIEALKKQLKVLFPASKIEVHEEPGQLVLSGNVKDIQIAKDAENVAGGFTPKVLNLLKVAGGQQIMLQVRFAEVSKSAEMELGINFGGSDGLSFLSEGGQLGKNTFASTGALPGSLVGPAGLSASLFGQGEIGKVAFQVYLDALKQNQLLRNLAEPDLITSSGQTATFLAGGSIPIPVSQGSTGGGSSISIQYQDFGVSLKFTPVVLGNGKIQLNVAPEVSELDYGHAIVIPGSGSTVPALTKRNLNTTVELSEGQTYAVGGLLQTQSSASNQSILGLGDLPVIGALFRSVQYQKDETELVVLVTPVFINGIDPADVTQIPGGNWHDPSAYDFFFKKDMGGELPDMEHAPIMPDSGPAPRFHGEFGFHPVHPEVILK
jgi:pilus assembly protein CpaC